MKRMDYTQIIRKREGKSFVYSIRVPWYVWLGLMFEEVCRPSGIGLIAGSGLGMLTVKEPHPAQWVMIGIGFLFGAIAIWNPIHKRVFKSII